MTRPYTVVDSAWEFVANLNLSAAFSADACNKGRIYAKRP